MKELGGLHILVNNASIQSHQHWTELDLKEFDRTMHANLFTPIRALPGSGSRFCASSGGGGS